MDLDKVIYGVKKISGIAMDVVFPKSCPMCDEVMERGRLICKKCEPKLVYIAEPKCKKCGKQIDSDEAEYCEDCGKTNHYYRKGIAAFQYNDMVSHSIYRFKYHNRRTYAEFYGSAIAAKYREEIERWHADVIIPVPIHERKMIKRGYNQAELIAKELGKNLGIKVDGNYLKRVVNTRPQKEMSRSERKKNMEKAFKISNSVVKYRKIILVDDIYTTGSTVDACAKVLLAAGACEVNCVCLSIGQGI